MQTKLYKFVFHNHFATAAHHVFYVEFHTAYFNFSKSISQTGHFPAVVYAVSPWHFIGQWYFSVASAVATTKGFVFVVFVLLLQDAKIAAAIIVVKNIFVIA
jgi:hypothetical protein